MKIDVVEHNPQLKQPVALILGLFSSEVSKERTSVEASATDAWSEKFPQESATVIDILIRNGALTEEVSVDGKPYAGSLQDIQLDESVPVDADVKDVLTITDDGKQLAESIDPAFTLRALFESRPHYRSTFIRVLRVCAADGGAGRETVEAAVESAGEVKNPDGKRVFPQYFMDALESAGGIYWQGAWKVTEAGLKVLAAA